MPGACETDNKKHHEDSLEFKSGLNKSFIGIDKLVFQISKTKFAILSLQKYTE